MAALKITQKDLQISYIYHLNQELGMALFDIDLYNWLLVDILQLSSNQISGDPVNDAVYLVLLPMVVMYLFVWSTIHHSRFAGTSVTAILMFVVGFFIVREGYYSVFAAFSLPLLIIIVLWNSVGFILGRKDSLSGARGPENSEVAAEKASMLKSLGNFVDDSKRLVGKSRNDAMFPKLSRDIRTLKTELDKNIDTFESMASSREGNREASKIVKELRSIHLELSEIERKINEGESIERKEKDIEDFRKRVKSILTKE